MSGNSSANSTAQPIPSKQNESARRSESPGGVSSRAQSELTGPTDESDLDAGLQSTMDQNEGVLDVVNQSSLRTQPEQPNLANPNYTFDLQFDTFQLPACARNCESVHTVKCHHKELCKSLYALYKEGEYCDTTIRCGLRTIQCHKLVLICVSGYFRSMFSSGMRESVENAVELRDLPDEAVANLIEFAYSGQIVLSTDNVQRLLFAASVLQIESVCVACDAFVRRHLTASNCVGVRSFAELHGRFELMRAVDSFIAENFPLVLSSAAEDFLAMNEASLAALLRQENLNVPNELLVYDTVLRWTYAEPDARREAFARLSSLVRFGQLPTEYLIDNVCNEPMVQSNPDCLRFVDEAKTFKLAQSFLPTQSPVPVVRAAVSASSPAVAKATSSASAAYSNAASAESSANVRWPYASAAIPSGSARCTPRRAYAGVIFCVGGRGSTGEPYRSVECYNPVENSWTFIAEMTSKRRHVGVISCGGRLYAIGGHDGVEHLNTGEVYEPRNNRWTRIANMSTKRRGLALASIGAAIYALGGLDDSTCMPTVERYNITTDQWANVAPMNVPRGGVACVVFANHIYAAGGNDGTNSVDSCEVFDPVLDRWSIISSMHYKRAGAGISALHDYVYVVGGFDNDLPLDTVEQYDFRTNLWTVLTRMSVCRGGAGLAALANRLFTVGGHDGTDYLLSVECFDPLEKRWINDVASISISRAGAGVTSCDVPIRVILDALDCSHAQPTGSMNTSGNSSAATSNPSVSQITYGLQHVSVSNNSSNANRNASSRGTSRSNNVSLAAVTSAAAAAVVAHPPTHANANANANNVAEENNAPPDWPPAVTTAPCVYHCNAYAQPAYQNLSDLRQCSASSSHHGAGNTQQRQHSHHHCSAAQSSSSNADASSPPPPPPPPSNAAYVCPYHQQLAKNSSRQRPASAAASSSGNGQQSFEHD